jgi:hypothetical protein
MRPAAPGFIGIAHPADVAAYLARADYTAVEGVSLGRGPLPVRTRHITASGEQLSKPQDQDFWVRRGEGELSWTPDLDRDHQVALVIVAPPGSEPVSLTASVSAGWLDSTTWGLLILGPVLTLLGLATLAWPTRRREIVYVMEPQVTVTVPAQPSPPAALPAAPPQWAWPPTESDGSTEAPRDLPMPLAGSHLHLVKRP